MSAISNILPNPPTNFSTTLSSGISDSDLTIPLNSVSGLGTEGVGVIYSKDSDSGPTVASIEFVHWTSVGEASIVLTDTDDRGITGSASGAQAHSAGDTFEVWVHPEYHFYGAVIDEDTMATNSADRVPTQRSVKAYADTKVGTTDTQTLTNKTIVQKVTAYTPEAAATVTLNLTTGNIHAITMPAGNITIAVSNEAVGQCFLIEITQDGTGSRTVTWFDTIRWAGGSAPTLTTTASKRDVFGFRVTGTDTYDGFVVGQNI